MRNLRITRLLAALAMVALALSSVDARTRMKAYVTDIFNGSAIQHTYFCLKNKKSCRSITGYGITSTKSGGDYISGTYARVTKQQRNRARFHSSNKVWHPCYIVYGITGVCHTQTNRGLWVRKKTIGRSQSKVGGSWASYIAYGTYGRSGWSLCKYLSKVAYCPWKWDWFNSGFKCSRS